MAINKDSNGYTFGFAIIMVVIVGAALALVSMGLKPRQEQNAVIKKKIDILSALLSKDEMGKINRSNAEAQFDNYVNLDDAVVLDMNGVKKEGVSAFDVDIRKEYKDKKLKDSDKNYPLFIAKKDGKTLYVIPVVGKGLWGPIWGNICLDEDMNTITGASFGHQGETPGLGAEITQQFFVDHWKVDNEKDKDGERLSDLPFEIVKDGSGKTSPKKVDGITGGTITSKGVEEMVNRCLTVYVKYFDTIK